MSETEYWFASSTEEFLPAEIVEHGRAAEQAGFDGLACSDHFAPWFPNGRGTQAWVTLGALGTQTTKPLGTSVTPIVHHYHPGLVAQAFMTLESLYPGRVFLGAGSGESVNESPLGLDWPDVAEQHERFERGLEAIVRLWHGETVTMDGGWFRLEEAKLWTMAPAPPKLYVSAFGPRAAAIAARWGDGLWSLGDPERAPRVIEAYGEACARESRQPGRVILHTGIAWADDERAAIQGARRWKPTQLPELYTDDISDQEEMQERADAAMSDEQFAKQGFVVGADPDEHVARIREIEQLGADVVSLQLIGQADPLGTIRVYGDTVLPALRGVRA